MGKVKTKQDDDGKHAHIQSTHQVQYTSTKYENTASDEGLQISIRIFLYGKK